VCKRRCEVKFHAVYTVIAVVLFVGHLVSNLYTDFVYRLPEFVWLGSIPFALLAAYCGIMTACKNEPAKRGTAIASSIVSVVVLLGLFISGSQWLFLVDTGYY